MWDSSIPAWFFINLRTISTKAYQSKYALNQRIEMKYLALVSLAAVIVAIIYRMPTTTAETITTKADFQKPSEAELKQRLTPLQYAVTQQDDTEPPFENEFWDEKREGIYVDIVSGEPLFSSRHKFKSGTGWPSFYRTIDDNHIVTRDDYHLIFKRTEVRSRLADSHLGHVFDDGPDPTGLRYCINSASLRFIPKEKLAEEGYGEYLKEFETK